MSRPRKSGTAPQAARQLRCACEGCGYVARVSRKWLADLGPPLCPCNSAPMECPEWAETGSAYQGPRNTPDPLAEGAWESVGDDVEQARAEECAALDKDASRSAGAVLADATVKARREHVCSACADPIPKGDTYRALKMRDASGALSTLAYCAGCDPGAREGAWTPDSGEGFYFAPDGTPSRA